MNQINDSEWEGNFPSPLGEDDLARWQTRLNNVAGMYDAQTPNVSLIWGMDGNEKWQVFDKIRNLWTLPYVSRYGKDGVDIGVARYFLRLVDPFLMDSPNQAARTIQATALDPDGREIVEDVYKVARARWRHVPYVDYLRWSLDDAPDASGMRPCCVRQGALGKPCYGEYLRPDRRMVKMVAKQFYIARHEAGDAVSAAKYIRFKLAQAEMEKEEREKQRQQQLADAAREIWTSAYKAQTDHWSLPGSRLIQPVPLIQLAH